MNILLIGSGGREHALAWKMAQSDLCDDLYIAPGNPGTNACGKNVPLDIGDFNALGAFCLENQIVMVVVGPEVPLVEGIVDHFHGQDETKHIAMIGPSKAAAQLEGSKDFSKAFMARHEIPTAGYQTFNQHQIEEGIEYIKTQTPPIVLKADGLAAGKGVIISESIHDAVEEFRSMLDGKFGDASARVVIEEFLDGIEFSVFVLSDGANYQILPTAKDYKRVGEGDIGLNTGGMGAVAPVPFVDEEMMDKVRAGVIEPSLKGMAAEGNPYKGFLYCGLIKVNGEPFVIEYNCRMGDPETEVVLPLLESDLVALFQGVAEENLDKHEIQIKDGSAATIVLASGGYPEAYEKGKTITGLDDSDALIFHAGTKDDDGNIVTSGGRVLAVTAFGENIKEAVGNALGEADKIEFEGKYLRRDIGNDLL